MNPKISIITVCFNAEKTIEETIKSVKIQTYKNIEYIIKDGKSKDGTLKVAKKYKNIISKVISSKDKGLYDAMNIAVKKATGDIVYFLNADDVLVDKHIIEEIAKEFEKENDLDMVYGDVDFFYPEKNKTIRIIRNASLSDIKNGLMPPHQGSFVKKKWLIKYPFDLSYKSSSDFDFFCNFLKENPKLKKIDKVIAKMLIGGVSSGDISYKETGVVVKKHFGLLYYIKIKLKHFVFKNAKKSFNLLGINYNKG